MSWITVSSLNWLQKIALNIIKTGSVPQHIAFIMDGNRRFADKNKVKKAEGHVKGFDKLSEALKWCLDLGVKEVTAYAFSIENFKRPEDEVNALMDLARQKFERLLEEEESLKKEGVNIRVIGDLSRLPPDLYRLIATSIYLTKDNTRARLTIAFSYTAKDEMTHAAKCIANGIKEKNLELCDIDTYLVEKCMYTEDSSPPDLLIRTSGEVRFSDFMLWQSSYAYAYFTSVLWPEFTFWDLLQAIFHYQRSFSTLQSVKNAECKKIVRNERVENFLKNLYKGRLNKLKAVACTS